MCKIKPLFIVLGIIGLVLISCKDNSNSENDADNKVSSKVESKDDSSIEIQLEDGKNIILNSPNQSGNLFAPSSLAVNMDKDGIVVMLKLSKYKTPLENKVYDDPLDAQITLTSISHSGPLGKESYRSFNENENGEEGKVRINLISHSENHAEGTFEGTLYSQNKKEAIIKGKFKTKKKK
ncbi:hypothetical protein [Aequorivita xiaoshiensis]|uniref:Lipoprotein n=1 Tax=Aequorivita xiaoshiensis TaxID=2874476 RepID=A0A9X1U4E9_9FLAO|nr:hypothetical protein [Aequorivita xiaoshiensis]MCG2431744.1 hypothetical protein [Aequorivita xiaoshiensis]